MSAEALLRQMFAAAIAAAQPERCLPAHLPGGHDAPLLVVGAGKGAASMARVVEQHWQGPLRGLVVTRYGHAVPCERIEVLEAGHPLPDANSVRAAERMLQLVSDLSAGTRVLCLLTGGGSSLLCLPAPGITLADKQRLNEAMLRSGMPIGAMNVVRRHLSGIKGGRLAAAAWPASMLTLAISDVPGDSAADIASGPTVADASTCADALALLQRFGIAPPPAVARLLASGAGESCKPGAPRLAHSEYRLIATPGMALQAAAEVARSAGLTPVVLGDHFEDVATDLAATMATQARAARHGQGPASPPCVLLSGGECRVAVRGTGCGGRNVEFLLALAMALNGQPGVHALAGDTDGIDGGAEIAGAVIAPTTLARAAALGLTPGEFLARNDAHNFFAALGNQVITGPTRTNVNDFRAVLIE